jgi:hypothetical protein
LGNLEVVSCATSDLWGEFFYTFSAAIIADDQGYIWVFHYANSMPGLVCLPVPFLVPLLLTFIIIAILDSKKIYTRLQANRASPPEQPKSRRVNVFTN